jgi:hypothetical protein
MTLIDKLTRSQHALVSTVRLWLIFLSCAAVAMVLIALVQRFEAAWAMPPAPMAQAVAKPAPSAPALQHVADHRRMPHVEFQPTFADAGQSLRAGRFAEAYGRFVTLADEGDADAGRIALVMHRYGPEVFGSTWDASTEQLVQWTFWSAAAAQQELARRPRAP